MPLGVYTVLFHHNSWTKRDLLAFKRGVERYREKITDLKTVISLYSSRRRGLVDVFYWELSYLNRKVLKIFRA